MIAALRHPVAILTALLAFATAVPAQQAEPYKPEVGQPGKDVIWVPTPEKTVATMLSVAKVGAGDFVIDLGCGDGRIVITAAQNHGAQGYGVDLNPDMIRLSNFRAERAGVADRAKFYVRDIFETDLKQASVVTMYLLPELNLRLRPTILSLKPGTRVVSHAFDMGDWAPDVYDTSSGGSVRLWIVPATAAGKWQMQLPGMSKPAELELTQRYQMLAGTARIGGRTLKLRDGALSGEAIRFSLADDDARGARRMEFSGKVNGGRIEGTVKAATPAASGAFSATRASGS